MGKGTTREAIISSHSNKACCCLQSAFCIRAFPHFYLPLGYMAFPYNRSYSQSGTFVCPVHLDSGDTLLSATSWVSLPKIISSDKCSSSNSSCLQSFEGTIFCYLLIFGAIQRWPSRHENKIQLDFLRIQH